MICGAEKIFLGHYQVEHGKIARSSEISKKSIHPLKKPYSSNSGSFPTDRNEQFLGLGSWWNPASAWCA